MPNLIVICVTIHPTTMRNLIRNFFPRFAFRLRYRGTPPWDSGVSPPELIEHIETHPPGRALDLGCGTGTNAITLAKHGWEVTGIDFIPAAIEKGRGKAQAAGVKADLRVGDVTQLGDLNTRFNLILDMGCHHSLPFSKRAAYRHNLTRWLAPGGTYLLYAFTSGERPIPGITKSDIEQLSIIFNLEKREDGTERDRRPSVWLWFSGEKEGKQ